MSEVAVPTPINRLFSDERLTRRAVGGDERAFAAIFRRYHQSLYRYCLAIVGNPEDAQDALQNTMTKVLRALPGEQREIDLKPWLYRIAHNESIDLLRRRRETRELDVEQVAPGYGLAEKAETRERLRRLLADLRELPERQRDVLVMREMSGFGFEEIATALETSSAVVRQTLYEARQSLRQMEEGREMSCDVVTRALSDGDGRVIRRRDVRAHLRTCAACRRFREEIESRERDFAALSPLPAVAAAGMLQGLLGGSQAASGGGIAALLGGGAAKTVGVSAAAKGVATVAVAAAVGVTAADRSGVIHLGLPGDGGARSSPAAPGAAPAADSEVGQGRAAGGVSGGDGAGDGRPEQAAGVHGSGAAKAAAPAARAEGAPAAADHGLESHPRSPQADSKAQGPPVEHGGGAGSDRGREEGRPGATPPGQEAAGGQKAPSSEQGGGGENAGGEKGVGSEKGGGRDNAPVDTPKSAPSPPADTPAQGKGPPSSPPAGKPETPPQSQAPPKAEAPGKPEASPAPSNPGAGAEKGKGAEKSAEAGKA